MGKQHAGHEDLEAREKKSRVPHFTEEHSEAQMMGLLQGYMASLTYDQNNCRITKS